MVKMTPRRYALREILGILVYPLIFFLLATLFYFLGLVSSEARQIFSWMVLLSIISGLVTYALTHSVVFGRRRRR